MNVDLSVTVYSYNFIAMRFNYSSAACTAPDPGGLIGISRILNHVLIGIATDA